MTDRKLIADMFCADFVPSLYRFYAVSMHKSPGLEIPVFESPGRLLQDPAASLHFWQAKVVRVPVCCVDPEVMI